MKFKKNIIYIYFILINFQNLFASLSGPEIFFYTPQKTKKEMGEFDMTVSAGKTNKGFNRYGAIVPFLQEYGSEDLLLRFLDPTLPDTNTEKLGSILFTGDLNITRFNLYYSKNICHNLFFGIGTIPQSLTAGNINMDITLDRQLTQDETFLLNNFQNTIPKNLDVSGLLTTFLDIGFNKEWENFNLIDGLQFYITGTIGTPQWIHATESTLLQYPLSGNIAFNYSVTPIIEIDLNKNITIGCFGTIISFQPQTTTIPIQKASANNHILLDHAITGILQIGRIFAADLYVEWKNIVKNMNATIGYGAIIANKSQMSSTHPVLDIDPTISLSSIFDSWYTSSIFFELAWPFIKENKNEVFNTSIFVVAPIAGVYYPKINMFGGTFGLSFNYNF
ncbi:MAG: hypothetical protein ACXWL2_00560 [Candidatus Chromulinivorax sp.]